MGLNRKYYKKILDDKCEKGQAKAECEESYRHGFYNAVSVMDAREKILEEKLSYALAIATNALQWTGKDVHAEIKNRRTSQDSQRPIGKALDS